MKSQINTHFFLKNSAVSLTVFNEGYGLKNSFFVEMKCIK